MRILMTGPILALCNICSCSDETIPTINDSCFRNDNCRSGEACSVQTNRCYSLNDAARDNQISFGEFRCQIDEEDTSDDNFSRFEWNLSGSITNSEGRCIYEKNQIDDERARSRIFVVDDVRGDVAVIDFGDRSPESSILGEQTSLIIGRYLGQTQKIASTAYATQGEVNISRLDEGVIIGSWNASQIDAVIAPEEICSGEAYGACGWSGYCAPSDNRCVATCGASEAACPRGFSCINSTCASSPSSDDNSGIFRCAREDGDIEDSSVSYRWTLNDRTSTEEGRCRLQNNILEIRSDTGSETIQITLPEAVSNGDSVALGTEALLTILREDPDSPEDLIDVAYASGGQLVIDAGVSEPIISGGWTIDSLRAIPSIGQNCAPQILNSCGIKGVCQNLSGEAICLRACEDDTNCPSDTTCSINEGACYPNSSCLSNLDCSNDNYCAEIVDTCESLPAQSENKLLIDFACVQESVLDDASQSRGSYSWRFEPDFKTGQEPCSFTSINSVKVGNYRQFIISDFEENNFPLVIELYLSDEKYTYNAYIYKPSSTGGFEVHAYVTSGDGNIRIDEDNFVAGVIYNTELAPTLFLGNECEDKHLACGNAEVATCNFAENPPRCRELCTTNDDCREGEVCTSPDPSEPELCIPNENLLRLNSRQWIPQSHVPSKAKPANITTAKTTETDLFQRRGRPTTANGSW